MCKIEGVTVEIKKVAFEKRGYMSVYLNDGRILMLPLKMFPEVKKMNAKERNGWFVVEGQYIGFDDFSEMYSIDHLLSLQTTETIPFS